MMRQTFVSPEPTEPTDPIILLIQFQRVTSETTDSFICVSFHNSFTLNLLEYVLPPVSVGSVVKEKNVLSRFELDNLSQPCYRSAHVRHTYRTLHLVRTSTNSSTPFLKRYGHPTVVTPSRRPIPSMARMDIVKPSSRSYRSLDLLYARAFNYIDETSIWPKYEVFPYLQYLTEAGVLPDWKWRYYAKYKDVVAAAGRCDLLKEEDHFARWVIDEDFRRSIKRIYLTFPDSILHFVLRAMGRLNGASMTKREYLELARSCGNCRNTALKYLNDILYRMQITIDSSNIINPENKVFILK